MGEIPRVCCDSFLTGYNAEIRQSAHDTPRRVVSPVAKGNGDFRSGAVACWGPGPAHEDELVASEARDGVPLALSRMQPLGHLDQQVVPGGVSQGVVDRLEPVEVEQQRLAASG